MAASIRASKFCSTNLIGIPMPADRFVTLEKVTGKTFETRDLGDGTREVLRRSSAPVSASPAGYLRIRVELAD